MGWTPGCFSSSFMASCEQKNKLYQFTFLTSPFFTCSSQRVGVQQWPGCETDRLWEHDAHWWHFHYQSYQAEELHPILYCTWGNHKSGMATSGRITGLGSGEMREYLGWKKIVWKSWGLRSVVVVCCSFVVEVWDPHTYYQQGVVTIVLDKMFCYLLTHCSFLWQ